MASRRVLWRPLAVADLHEILKGADRDGAEEAGQALRDRIGQLGQSPMEGRSGRPGVQSFVHELVGYPPYIVFYRVLGADVEILRVKHAVQREP